MRDEERKLHNGYYRKRKEKKDTVASGASLLTKKLNRSHFSAYFDYDSNCMR